MKKIGCFSIVAIILLAVGFGLGYYDWDAMDVPEYGVLPPEILELGAGDAASPKVLHLRLVDEIGPQSEDLLIDIRKATGDDTIDGIYLELDTPGGEVTMSDMLADALMRFRESDTNRFVVAHMLSECCSGGYYVASGADVILAHPTTMTGSIGVIMSTVNAAELANKLGVKSVAIATGGNKNMLDPLEPVDEKHVEIFRKVLASDYERFVETVATSRRLPVEKVRELADGRVFSAAEARALGLIDEICYFEDALSVLESLAGVKDGAYRLVRWDRDRSWTDCVREIFELKAPSLKLQFRR